MRKKNIFLGILFILALSVSGCASYGGGYGQPEGYGSNNNDPFSYHNRDDSQRYQHMNDGY